MADEITELTGQDVALISGDRGEFSVWVGDRVVARKSMDGFPPPHVAAQAVADALKA